MMEEVKTIKDMTEKLQQDIIDLIHQKDKKIKILSIVDINYNDNVTDCQVTYICFKPSIPSYIFYQSIRLNLVEVLRDSKLEELFNQPKIEFDVEDYIYTEEEREKLHQLRKNETPTYTQQLFKFRKEYSDQFQIGQKVWYQGQAGFITFKHESKEDQLTRWSVKVKDNEHRYLNGTNLLPRQVEDLSHIEIDPVLNKLKTKDLLKIMNRTRHHGKADPKIKRILQEREHVRRDDDKIIIDGKVVKS